MKIAMPGDDADAFARTAELLRFTGGDMLAGNALTACAAA
jgi:hypothetical protein